MDSQVSEEEAISKPFPIRDALDRLAEKHNLEKKARAEISTEQREKWRQEDSERTRRREEEERQSKARYCLSEVGSNLGKRYSRDRTTLDAFQLYDKRQGEAMRRVLDIQKDMRAFVDNGANLIFFGHVGTGKDHLLAYLLYEAAALGISCRYANGQELFSRFRGTMDDKAHENERDILREFTIPDVVALSDPLPPAGNNSDWRREIFYRLMDIRYRAMKSTWITANTSTADADQAFTEPVWDRLQHGATVITCDWQSWRERKK